MSLALPKEFILYDTEYTSWAGFKEAGWQGEGKYREVIQIGALRVGDSLVEQTSFNVFVKPIKNPQLSDYITTLTGITQEKIDTEGVTLEQALQQFSVFADNLPLYAYGQDAHVIQENCKLADVIFPFDTARFGDLHGVVDQAVRARGIDPTQYSSGTFINAFGKQGAPAHDAVNDMRNLLEVLREL